MATMRRFLLDAFFAKATLFTANEEIELRLSGKGYSRGKLIRRVKGHQHIDTVSILSESLTGVRDQSERHRILEDRRRLLLSDPHNKSYKQLYAEAKQKVEQI
jgi:hypothetical protein